MALEQSFAHGVQTKLFTSLTVILLVGLIFFAGPVSSEMDCTEISHWSITTPPINQQHVFCGEWNERKNRPAGFHSRPAGKNPATVGTLKITQQPKAGGLYGVRWSYAGHPDREKISSIMGASWKRVSARAYRKRSVDRGSCG
jgi:hypothetical protein